MRNGLYGVQFNTPIGSGAGVVTLADGKLSGGDSALYYLGTYYSEGNRLSAEMRTGRHSLVMPSVFGIDNLLISLSGTIEGDKVQFTAIAQEAPSLSVWGSISRLAD